MQNKTDEELMELYLEDHLLAFQELYQRHSGKLFGYLQKKVPPQVAEELLQDVFARMHSAKHTYNDKYLFLPWCFTITRHTLFDYYKRAETKISTNSQSIDDSHLTTEENIAYSNDFLENLSPKQKKIFELRYLQDWSFEEIANATSLTQSNVRQIISRGIKYLKVKGDLS